MTTEVDMQVETLNEMQVLHVEQAISLKQQVADCYSVEYDEPHGLMLVEPINADPYVVKLPNTLFRFKSVPANSGTSKLRARIEAGLFYNRLKGKGNG